MAQLYFLDSQMLIHHGLPVMAYLAWDDYDPAKHGISEYEQELPENIPMLGTPYFRIGSLSAFFKRDDGNHPVMVAISEQFTTPRWEDIEILSDAEGCARDLEHGKFNKCKKKFQKIENDGGITPTELETIEAILNQFI